MKKVNLSIFLFSITALVAAEDHPFRNLDEDHRKILECSAEASQKAYHSDERNPWNLSRNLQDRGYVPVSYCPEKNGVFTVGWYNDRTHNLIVAHRGTVINNSENLFSDLGIVEAAVRVVAGNHKIIPDHRGFTELLTQIAREHIAEFCGDEDFSLSRLSSAEKLIVDRILNFDLVYNSFVNTYQTRGALTGVATVGVFTILASVTPPLAILGLMAGAGGGGVVGNMQATEAMNGYLSAGRSTLSNTLDVMYDNTKSIFKHVRERSSSDISLTITGHSLGAAGALGVAARFESEGYQDFETVLFNAPGGHYGLVEIWKQDKGLDINFINEVPVYTVKRKSCIVSRLGLNPSTATYTFDPLPHEGRRGIEEWSKTLIPSHSIKSLIENIFE